MEKENLEAVYTMALKVYRDSFLKTYITEIHQNENKEISLKMRLLDFEVLVGTLENLDEKMKNLKARAGQFSTLLMKVLPKQILKKEVIK